MGTADYVAPEQVMDSRNVDGRADIYSLGYTFYFLLTGRRPFPKSTLVELLMAHRVESPEPISNLRPDVPLELIEIIDRMTAKSPDLRFQTAKDVAERLQTWLHDSESRDYSRISALVAAAKRAKQPGSDSSAGKPESAARNKEPELAFLDDEPANSAGAKGAESHRSDVAKPPEADAREKPRKPGPGDSGRTAALRPGDSGRTAALPRAKADLLLELNAQPTLGTRPQFKHRSSANSVLKSPWLWIALAGLLCALFLILAILSALSGSEQPPAKKLVKKSDIRSTAPPSPVQTPPEDEVEQAKSPDTPKAGGGVSNAAPPPSFASAGSSQPPAEHPSKPPPESSPTEKPPEKKDNPAAPPPEKPAEIDKVKLLANVKQISFHYADSDATNKPRYVTVQRVAAEAARSLHPGIEVVATSPNVMELELKAPTADSGLVLTVELKCRAADGSDVPVWNYSGTVVARQDPAAIRVLLRPGARQFFKKFIEDVLNARSKIHSN